MKDFSDAVADAILPLFGGRPDGTYQLPPVREPTGDEVREFETMAALADRTDRDIADMMAMSWLDLLEEAIAAAVKTQSMLLRAHLYQVDRRDLLEPWLERDDAT